MKDRHVQKLQRQVKSLQKDLRKAHKTVKGFQKSMEPAQEDNSSGVGNFVKNMLFGAQETQPSREFDPSTIPRDHIVNPSSLAYAKKAVMEKAGRGEEVLSEAEAMYDADLLFEAQLKEMEQRDASLPPAFIADACYNVEDQHGLKRWRKLYEKKQKDLLKNPVDNHSEPEPISVIAMQGGEAEILTSYLSEKDNCYGALGYAPSFCNRPLDDIDRTLTEAFNTYEELVAIGPIGLDVVRLDKESLPQQKALLKRQLEIAVDFFVPVLLSHSSAADLLRSTIEEFPQKDELIAIWTNPLSCKNSFDWVIKNGFYIAIDAQITYENQKEFISF
ncbi:MAG: TatD family hydrolase, partial [Alphaproteobacteria bacterium]|nr:TatD family hydrolase [Alphaproteobacteria bacterium]